MIRKSLIIIALLIAAACSQVHVSPQVDCPREGGIGGTGGCVAKEAAS